MSFALGCFSCLSVILYFQHCFWRVFLVVGDKICTTVGLVTLTTEHEIEHKIRQLMPTAEWYHVGHWTRIHGCFITFSICYLVISVDGTDKLLQHSMFHWHIFKFKVHWSHFLFINWSIFWLPIIYSKFLVNIVIAISCYIYFQMNQMKRGSHPHIKYLPLLYLFGYFPISHYNTS